VMYL